MPCRRRRWHSQINGFLLLIHWKTLHKRLFSIVYDQLLCFSLQLHFVFFSSTIAHFLRFPWLGSARLGLAFFCVICKCRDLFGRFFSLLFFPFVSHQNSLSIFLRDSLFHFLFTMWSYNLKCVHNTHTHTSYYCFNWLVNMVNYA